MNSKNPHQWALRDANYPHFPAISRTQTPHPARIPARRPHPNPLIINRRTMVNRLCGIYVVLFILNRCEFKEKYP